MGSHAVIRLLDSHAFHLVTLEASVTSSLLAKEILTVRGTFVRRIADSCIAERTVRTARVLTLLK
jgi:hypothetical protein